MAHFKRLSLDELLNHPANPSGRNPDPGGESTWYDYRGYLIKFGRSRLGSTYVSYSPPDGAYHWDCSGQRRDHMIDHIDSAVAHKGGE